MTTNKQSAFWTKDLLATCATNFCIMLTYFLLLVTISGYTMKTHHTSASTAGLVAGIMVIGTLVGRFFTGSIIHIVGIRKVLFVGTLFFAFTMGLYFFASNLPLLLIIRFISGIAVGLIGTATGTAVAHLVPRHRRGEGISYYSMSTVLATAIGPFLGITLLFYFPYSSLFILGIFLGLLSALFVTQITIDHRTEVEIDANAEKHSSSAFELSNFIAPQALPIALLAMIVAIGYAGLQAYLLFFTEELHLAQYAGMFFFIYAIVILISRPFTGKLLDTHGENIIIYPALFLTAAGFFTLSQVQTPTLLFCSALLIGLGFGNFQSTAQAVSIKIVPFSLISQATSTFFIFFDIGIGLSPYLLGLLIPYISYAHLYTLVGVITLIAIPLYWLIHHHPQSKITTN